MLLRILLAFFGGFALAVAGAIAWISQQGDGKLPPLEWLAGGGLATGVIAALLTWLKMRPSAEVRRAAAAENLASGKTGAFRLTGRGKAKAEEEPLIENFQRRRGPADLSASAAIEAAPPEPMQGAQDDGVEQAGPAQVPLIDPVSVIRRARHQAADWSGARSWLGGQPRLGDTPWPAGARSGRPLPFGAQIDLGELARLRPDSPLPKAGWLACFLDEGAVVYVPAQANGDRYPITPAPADAAAAYEPEGPMFPADPSPYARRSFPYWPVELVSAEVAHWDAEDMPVTWADFPANGLLWWRSVRLFIEQLRRSLHRAPQMRAEHTEWLEHAERQLADCRSSDMVDAEALAKAEQAAARQAKKLAALDREIAGMPAVIGLLEDFAGEAPDWKQLPPSDRVDFENTFSAISQQFPKLIRYYTSGEVGRLAALTMHEMFTGDAAAFEALPEEQREIVNTAMRRSFEHGHQIFGTALDIHGGAGDLQPDHLLLLQMVDDEMIHLNINSGAYSFWLDPASIASREWSRAKVIVEC